jgi:hypothetical protein
VAKGKSLELHKRYKPQTAQYLARLVERPAYIAALREEEASSTSFNAATLTRLAHQVTKNKL